MSKWQKTRVDMMHQEANFSYTDDETMQVVELPYGNKAFSMMVLLPKADKEVTDVIKALQDEDIGLISKIKCAIEYRVVLPKFKTEYSKNSTSIE